MDKLEVFIFVQVWVPEKKPNKNSDAFTYIIKVSSLENNAKYNIQYVTLILVGVVVPEG